jgi:glutamate carboxypeptidase
MASDSSTPHHSSVDEAESRLMATIAARSAALLDDLNAFVAIPTGPGADTGLDTLRALMSNRLAALGATCEELPGDAKPDWLDPRPRTTPPPPTLLARRTQGGSDAAPRLLLSGHLDTVHDPLGPFRQLSMSSDKKTATGPGCVDMKGGLVIALHALEVLHAQDIPARWSFVLNSDEETGSFHSDRALRSVAKSHDVGLALEPAMPDGGLVVERPGSGQFMIECTGRAAHVGRDFANGISAVSLLAERVLRVARIPRPTMGIIANVGPLEGGIATNVVPDRARAWGNVRFPTTPDAEYLKSSINALATSTSSMPRAAVELTFNRPAKPLTPQVQHLANLARSAAEALGQSLPFGKTGGVCDGNNLQAAGLPTIDTLGVRGGGLHTPQEWIDLSSLVERCQLLALLLHRITRDGFHPASP